MDLADPADVVRLRDDLPFLTPPATGRAITGKGVPDGRGAAPGGELEIFGNMGEGEADKPNVEEGGIMVPGGGMIPEIETGGSALPVKSRAVDLTEPAVDAPVPPTDVVIPGAGNPTASPIALGDLLPPCPSFCLFGVFSSRSCSSRDLSFQLGCRFRVKYDFLCRVLIVDEEPLRLPPLARLVRGVVGTNTYCR